MIEATRVDGVAILYLTGDFDASASQEVRELVHGRLTSGDGCIVLDLRGVDHIFTAGILALSELQRAAAGVGCKLICCSARPFLRELLRITMLDLELDLQVDVERALAVSVQAS